MYVYWRWGVIVLYSTRFLVEPTRLGGMTCDYHRGILHFDGITRSMKLPLESYSTRENTNVGARALLEAEQEKVRVRVSKGAPTPHVRRSESCRRDVGIAVGGLSL